jgi:hypothetical protein
MVEIVRLNGKRRVQVIVQQDDGSPIDVLEESNADGTPKGYLELEVTDLSNTSLFSASYYPPEVPASTRLLRVSTGRYEIQWGTDDNETEVAGNYLFNWTARVNEDSDEMQRTQVLFVVSPNVLFLLPQLRLMIDKTIKPTLPEEYCFLGYTDSQLLMYLVQGLTHINGRPPYPTWARLDDFPIDLYADVLIKSALYAGLTSQTLFALDTDIPNYSDQGHSFTLAHFQPLKSMIDSLKQELDKYIPEVKHKFLRVGRVSAELRMGYGFYQMLVTAPPGATFRNWYTTGSW